MFVNVKRNHYKKQRMIYIACLLTLKEIYHYKKQRMIYIACLLMLKEIIIRNREWFIIIYSMFVNVKRNHYNISGTCQKRFICNYYW